MKLIGLIGFPLLHSLSKLYFEEKFRLEKITGWSYDIFPLQKLPDLHELIISKPDLVGFNVTVPHKIAIMAQLDTIDPTAKKIGAVNTVQINHNKSKKGYLLTGHNTDIDGFEAALLPLLSKQHKKALILGSGGAARAVTHVLKKLGIEFKMVSREPDVNQLGYQELNRQLMQEHTLLVNCTPLGTFPKVQDAPPIPYEFLNETHLLFDLVYNPAMTRFLKNGSQRGAQTINGMEMLKKQAESSWELWSSKYNR